MGAPFARWHRFFPCFHGVIAAESLRWTPRPFCHRLQVQSATRHRGTVKTLSGTGNDALVPFKRSLLSTLYPFFAIAPRFWLKARVFAVIYSGDWVRNINLNWNELWNKDVKYWNKEYKILKNIETKTIKYSKYWSTKYKILKRKL